MAKKLKNTGLLRIAFLLFLFFLAGAFIYLFVYAYKSEMKDREVRKTMKQAPFAPDGLPIVDGGVSDTTSLAVPHKTTRELSRWINKAVSESLTLSSGSYDEQVREAKKYFSEKGYAQYVTSLSRMGLADAIKNNNFRSSPIMESSPLLLNEWVGNGVYRWLYQIPLMISYVPKNVKRYSKNIKPINRRILLQIQLKRTNVQDDLLEDSVKTLSIESWKISAPKRRG